MRVDPKLKYILAVNAMFFLYSFVSVLGKLAAKEGEINFRFIMLYGGSLAVMGIYALCWQQIIKKIPLIVAYANKAVVIIWGLLWGVLFFDESVTTGKIAGIFFVVVGVILFATSESEKSS